MINRVCSRGVITEEEVSILDSYKFDCLLASNDDSEYSRSYSSMRYLIYMINNVCSERAV